jgi:glucose/arabinose dehydrogenase
VSAGFQPRTWTRAIGNRLAIASLAAVLTFAFACAGDDSPSPEPSATPAATPLSTQTPAQVATAEAAPVTATVEPVVGLPEEPRVGLQLVADGLTAPLDFAAPDDGSGRLFVVEQIGVIRVLLPGAGEPQEPPFLDLRDRIVPPDPQFRFDERGTLGIALHPDFATNRRLFVYYSAPLREGAPPDWDHTSHLSEFTVFPDDENRADPESERIIMQIDQPGISHNAGHIRFGPDGYLYVPLGDGAATGGVGEGHTPVIGNAQDRTNLLGSILRIDVDQAGDADRPYGIPPDNPFVDVAGARPEIWAYGLRNPFDISFDPAGEHALLIASAGEFRFEWVDLARGGENFGWSIREGSHCFNPGAPHEPIRTDCPDRGPWGEPLVAPVVEYAREEFGTVIVGVQLYRGQAHPDLWGRMVIADWSYNWSLGAQGALFVAGSSGDAGQPWAIARSQSRATSRATCPARSTGTSWPLDVTRMASCTCSRTGEWERGSAEARSIA